ncbi:MAG: hypothetical protein CMN72_16555 [Sphingomonas sp.]|nr:hypothetical protein [Sphingomonas sp.]MAX01212.1 hypothetical protein [Sphingomonas sp.]|tara:strand:- start:71 stop:385 length:315 start_codon:yes stop_codon:yes gene_type:complete
MGKGIPWIPSAYANIGATLDQGGKVKTMCDQCKATRELTDEDLERIAAIKGRDYALTGRRTRCRLTAGCEGWNRFWYWNAFWRPLWRDEDDTRWLLNRKPIARS